MINRIILNSLILLGVYLPLLMSISQLLMQKKNFRNYLASAVFLSIALYQFSHNFYIFSEFSGWNNIYPAIVLTDRISMFLLLPFTFLYFRSLLNTNYVLTRITLVHFIPLLLVIILYPVFGLLTPDLANSQTDYTDYLLKNSTMYRISALASLTLALGYAVWLIVLYAPTLKSSSREKRMNIVWIIILLAVIITGALAYIFYYLGVTFLYNLIQIRFTIVVIVVLLLSYRYPFVLNIVKLEAYRDQYLSTQVSKLDIENILARLELLMENDQLFTDPALTKEKVAKLLHISSHQFSEIMNKHLAKRFTVYLNEKRIDYASTLLIQKPDEKIISIALDSGFNTISNFNTTFKAIVKISPTEYRRKHGSDHSES